MYPASTIVIQNAVKPHQMGVATGALNFFRLLGGAIIVAGFGAIVLGSAGSAGGLATWKAWRPDTAISPRRFAWCSSPARFSRDRARLRAGGRGTAAARTGSSRRSGGLKPSAGAPPQPSGNHYFFVILFVSSRDLHGRRLGVRLARVQWRCERAITQCSGARVQVPSTTKRLGGSMAAARVHAVAAILVALIATAPLVAGALAPATAQEPVRAEPARPRPIERPHACLNPKERQAAVESGTVLRLAAALHAVQGALPGTLVRARLCRTAAKGLRLCADSSRSRWQSRSPDRRRGQGHGGRRALSGLSGVLLGVLGLRLLVVEDDPDLNRQLATALTDAGYVVDRAFDGEEGHYLGESEPYDAVILDIGLPKMDGISVLESWRRAGRAMPVLILTARDRWSDKVQGFDAGADDYVAKPFHLEEVLARVRALLRRSAGHAKSEFTCGPVRLDTRTGRVAVDGNPVKLTSHEYRLLSYLMHHTGRVVSRTELVEHLYDQDFDRDSNTIEVFVGRIRKKLGVDVIQTVRGLGYLLTPPDAR